MNCYMAELDADHIVLRVVVAPASWWPAEHLGGTWVESDDPCTTPGDVGVAVIGATFNPQTVPQFTPPFAPPDNEGAYPPDERSF